MDILTLGKMNQMAKDVDQTLEYLANATFQSLKDVCQVQENQLATIEQAVADGGDALRELGGGGKGYRVEDFYNENARGCHCFTGCSTSWTVPEGVRTITFEAWGGGGAGAGHCCHGCYCDMASCGSQGGVYARKTICLEAGDFAPGDVYSLCMGDGGNANSGTGCWTACCDAPRGCASYVTGNGLDNFCAPGGRGGYNLYCSCRCAMNHCWHETPQCLGLCVGQNVDFAATATGMEFFKSRGNCDCNSRYTRTGRSYGLSNEITQHIEDSMAYCGCETPCQSYRIAGGGMNMQKSYCGNWNCNCLGSPGHSGMIRITYA